MLDFINRIKKSHIEIDLNPARDVAILIHFVTLKEAFTKSVSIQIHFKDIKCT